MSAGKDVKQYVFRAFLLLLLASAIALNVRVFMKPDDPLFAPPPPAQTSGLPSQPSFQPSPHPAAIKGTGPGWRAEARVEKRQDGTYKVVILSFFHRESPGKLTSYQVFLQSMDGKTEEDISSSFTKNDSEELTGVISHPPPWQLRVRLRRNLSILVFTHRMNG